MKCETQGPIVPVESLRSRERGKIVQVCGESGCENRMREMGLCVGCQVEMCTPGRPCIISVEGRKMSLRLEDSTMILVEAGT